MSGRMADVERQQIVEEIKRITRENNGHAPGRQAFASATGIKIAEWYPHLWLRWGDALTEAGYAPNPLQTKASDEVLIEKYIHFTRQLGRFPIGGRFAATPGRIPLFPLTQSLTDSAEKISSSKLSLCTVARMVDLKISWRYLPNANARRSPKQQARTVNGKSRLNLSTS